MMAVNVKRLNSDERVWLDREGAPIDTAPFFDLSDRQQGLSRRQQALLAAAGESEPDRRWYVLCVVSGHENAVDDDLQRRHVETWLPIDAHRPKRRAGRGKSARCERGEVAFDGYLFVRICPTARIMQSLMRTDSVIDAIGGWERPVPVSDSDISRLQAFVAMSPRERRRQEAELRKYMRGFEEGDTIMVLDGVFKGMQMRVERIGKDSAWGFMPLPGREIAITMPLANLLDRD